MKILMIAPTPFFSDRGCHIRIYEEICGLQKLGHDVLLCTYGIGNNIENVKTVRCFNFPWYKKLSAGPSISKIFLLPFLLFTSIKSVINYKPDIIHAHLHEGACIAHCVKLFFPKIPIIFDMQGGLCEEVLQHDFIKKNSIWHKLLFALEKKIINWQPIIMSSSHMLDDVKNMGGKLENCHFVKDGIDTDFFSPRECDIKLIKELKINTNEKRILFVGLLEKYQGIDILLEAFKKVLISYPKSQLIVMGYPNVEYYKEKCVELKINNNVVFTGRVNYIDLPNYLSLANIAVAPKLSTTEGNIKIYDYMSMEMATICFKNVINEEILEDTGIYVEDIDANKLAEKIVYSFNNDKKCKQLGKKGRKLAIKKLSNIDMALRIEKVYKKIINFNNNDFNKIEREENYD